MAKLVDRVWLWGQTPGSHHATAGYNLPGVNRMDSREGCDYFGIRNCCRVAMSKGPFPPFDSESEQLKDLDKVVWSALGAGGVTRNEEQFGDLEEVIRQAKMYPNIVGAVMDDFLLTERRRENFVPAKLRQMRGMLRSEAGRSLEFWTVYYDRELEIPVKDYLEEFDVITFWTWYGENILKLRKNLDFIMKQTPDKRFMAGCYMWDYGNRRQLAPGLMETQLEIYREYMLAGKLEGIILCSNCIADVGIPEVEYTRQWLKQHGGEDL